MATLPASNYLQDSARTVSEQKQAFEDQRDFISTLAGSAARSILTISGGQVTPVVRDHGGSFSIDTEASAASDDLDVILNTNLHDGAIIRIFADNASRVVTAKHGNGGAGEMLMVDSADFILDDLNKWIEFQRDGTVWKEVGRSYGADSEGARASLQIPRALSGSKLCPNEVLTITRPSVSSVSVTADALILQNTNGFQKYFDSFSETASITSSGAGGLDSGSEANSTWYHIWAIAQSGGTTSLLLSVSSSSPTMPGGYEFFGYLGACYNDAGGNIAQLHQQGNIVDSLNTALLNLGSAASYTSVSASTAIPPTAKRMYGYANVNNNSAATSQVNIAPTNNSDELGVSIGSNNTQVALLGQILDFEIGIHTAQTFYYKVSGSGSPQVSINSTGWSY